MPFIRKVRVVFKTRLIFPRINGPSEIDSFGFELLLSVFDLNVSLYRRPRVFFKTAIGSF